MQKLVAFKKTRFYQLCMAHPYAIAFGSGFLALGFATGVSTGALLSRCGLLIECMVQAEHSMQLLRGMLRLALFDLMLCCGVLSAALRPSFLPLSCASLALKGFAIGLAVKQLYLDYAWWGIVCGMIGVVLPSCCMLTGLILCFGYGASRLRGIQKASSTREKDENATLMPCVRLTVFLTAMGILAEGVMAQVILRFLLTFAASN